MFEEEKKGAHVSFVYGWLPVTVCLAQTVKMVDVIIIIRMSQS